MAKRRKKESNIGMWIIIAVVVFAIVGVSRQASFSAATNKFTQINGVIDWGHEFRSGAEDDYVRPLTKSHIAEFGDLKITSSKGAGWGFYTCKPKPTAGQGGIVAVNFYKGVGTDGCPRWDVRTSSSWSQCSHRGDCSALGYCPNGRPGGNAHSCNWGSCICTQYYNGQEYGGKSYDGFGDYWGCVADFKVEKGGELIFDSPENNYPGYRLTDLTLVGDYKTVAKGDSCGDDYKLINHTDSSFLNRYRIYFPEIYWDGVYANGGEGKNAEYWYANVLETDLCLEWTEDTVNYENSWYTMPGGVKMKFYNSAKYQYGSCARYENYFSWEVPSELIQYEFEALEPVSIEGQVRKLEVTITNNFQETKAELTMDMRIPIEGFQGTKEFTDSQVKDVDLNVGRNIVEFTLPTEQEGSEIFVKPSIRFYSPGSFVSGVNVVRGSNYGMMPLNNLGLVPSKIVYAELVGDEEQILVAPKPTYLPSDNGSCSGYENYRRAQFDSDICIREDLDHLSCLQIGCPVGATVDYMCMSNGQCSEFILQHGCDTDVDCEGFDAVCRENIEGDNFCVKTIFDEIITPPKVTIIDATCEELISSYCTEGHDCEDREVDGKMVGTCTGRDEIVLASGETPWLWILIGSAVLFFILIRRRNA